MTTYLAQLIEGDADVQTVLNFLLGPGQNFLPTGGTSPSILRARIPNHDGVKN